MANYLKWLDVEVNLSDIVLDKLNPRVIINEDITQEKIINYLIDYFDVIDLANSINESYGLAPADKIVCIKENNQYIVVEGNRRITACKILQNPNLLPVKYRNLLNKPNIETLNSINKLSVCLAPNRDEAEPYITLRHSDYGIKKWSTLAQIQRVMQRYNLRLTPQKISQILELKTSDVEKSIKFYNFLEYIKTKLDWSKHDLEIISDPLLETTKLDRFLPFSNKAKSMLHIDFDENYNLIIGINEDSFKKALKIIISNIFIYDKYNTRTKLEIVFNDEIAKLCEENNDNPCHKENNITIATTFVQENNTTSTNKSHNDKQKDSNCNPTNAQDNTSSEINTDNTVEEENNNNNLSRKKDNDKPKTSIKNNPKPSNFFDNFKWTALNNTDPLQNGIISLCNELKQLSKSKDYKKYPIATSIIMRAILENSLIYYAQKTRENNDVLKKIQRIKNDQIIGYKCLDDILKEYTKEAKIGVKGDNCIFYNKEPLLRLYTIFTESPAIKTHFNLIIHQPGSVIATYTVLENIANSGFKAFLEGILN